MRLRPLLGLIILAACGCSSGEKVVKQRPDDLISQLQCKIGLPPRTWDRTEPQRSELIEMGESAIPGVVEAILESPYAAPLPNPLDKEFSNAEPQLAFRLVLDDILYRILSAVRPISRHGNMDLMWLCLNDPSADARQGLFARVITTARPVESLRALIFGILDEGLAGENYSLSQRAVDELQSRVESRPEELSDEELTTYIHSDYWKSRDRRYAMFESWFSWLQENGPYIFLDKASLKFKLNYDAKRERRPIDFKTGVPIERRQD